MNRRLIASAALGAAVLLGTSGCAMISTQATTIPYSPGDGVNIPESGPVLLRNVLVVSEEEGGAGNMIASVVNDTDEAQSLTIELGEGAGAESTTLRIPARTSTTFGTDEDPIPFEEIDGPPGSTVSVYFQSGDGEGVLYQVPVLDGELDYYNELLP